MLPKLEKGHIKSFFQLILLVPWIALFESDTHACVCSQAFISPVVSNMEGFQFFLSFKNGKKEYIKK